MQKGIRLNDGHVASLGLLARKDGTRKGYLSKRSSDNTKWQTKWFALLQNLLFYFESDSSSRPSGLYLLEGCVCDRAPSPKPALSAKEPLEKQHYFTVNFSHENQKALELRTEDAKDCDEWVAAIAHASYRTLATEHEALMQKYLHLLQIVETEKTVATQLRRQIEDGEVEIERLKAEIATLLRDNERVQSTQTVTPNDEDSDIKKIKKSLLLMALVPGAPQIGSPRGPKADPAAVICGSPDGMGTRPVALEPPCDPGLFQGSPGGSPSRVLVFVPHQAPQVTLPVLTVFALSETIMFLHQIFYQGLKARISSWPTLVLVSLQVHDHVTESDDDGYTPSRPPPRVRTRDPPKRASLGDRGSQVLCLDRKDVPPPPAACASAGPLGGGVQSPTTTLSSSPRLGKLQGQHIRVGGPRGPEDGPSCLLSCWHVVPGMPREPLRELLPSGGSGRCSGLSRSGSAGPPWWCPPRASAAPAALTLVRDRDPRRPLVILPFSDMGTWMREPVGGGQTLSPPPRATPAAGQLSGVGTTSTGLQRPRDAQQTCHLEVSLGLPGAGEGRARGTSDASLYCDDVDIRFSKTMNSCKVLQIRYASVGRLLERLTDLRFLSIDFLNTFLHSYRVFTTAVVVLDKLITIYRKPISAIPARSLELLFASGQNSKLLYGDPPKSPRATRKFSSPPPLSIAKTSSPGRRRKLSLNIPIITGGKALDLAALSCNSNGYSSLYSAVSPFSKASLDTSKLYVSSGFANKIPDEGDPAAEKPEEPSALSKQSSEVSVREESDNDEDQSEDGDTEASPTKSPTTPKSVKSKNPSEFPLFSYNNGVVMTSCRELDNSRSALSAASAFAIATAGANEGAPSKDKYRRMSLASTGFPPDQRNGDKEFVIRRAATNRVLNVLRHWVSKHSQDFETNNELRGKVISFLEEVMHDPELLTQERKAAANIIRGPGGGTCEGSVHGSPQRRENPKTKARQPPSGPRTGTPPQEAVTPAEGVKAEPFENHSALEIAEQLTLLDHLVFKKIPYEEFFGQGWMKLEKNERTPYIMKTTKHFNDISNLIASEIIRNEDINARVSAIEKWVAVADICRCLHNYNAVLEITSSMNRSAIFRLKKTWLKVSKQTKALIDKLQKLVSSEGRFKNLREALKNCDPPCVPYLGMYLTDLAFIEEGTPNYTEDGLVNFSKMRMISHIIREIRQFQQTAYKIEHQVKVSRRHFPRHPGCHAGTHSVRQSPSLHAQPLSSPDPPGPHSNASFSKKPSLCPDQRVSVNPDEAPERPQGNRVTTQSRIDFCRPLPGIRRKSGTQRMSLVS
ncbi:ras-specific guanine nucleotide-releasing factor 1 [Puma concolor]|uniref:Ras-specific guanine nucleotide-releasing factor 1 n=1 Tax=Puma concolor TaxID=9696 RepID=A0A6P6HGK5_PUMCO|nr:ras-specific guanine nucleotide-releasing factor 1 [Puma concolor]